MQLRDQWVITVLRNDCDDPFVVGRQIVQYLSVYVTNADGLLNKNVLLILYAKFCDLEVAGVISAD